MKEISLKISDIDCAACVERLNRALGAVNGVRDAAVNYASGRALISYDEDEASIVSIAAAVKKAGFGVPADSVELKCPALDAETMSRALAALRAMEEVQSAEQNAETGSILVRVWPVNPDSRRLLAALREVGVWAELGEMTSGEEESEVRKRLALLRLIVAATLLSVPLVWEMHYLVQFVIATVIQFWPGMYFYRGAWRGLRNGTMNMDVLVALSTTIIYIYSSCVAFTVPIGKMLYFLSNGVLIALLLFGLTAGIDDADMDSDRAERIGWFVAVILAPLFETLIAQALVIRLVRWVAPASFLLPIAVSGILFGCGHAASPIYAVCMLFVGLVWAFAYLSRLERRGFAQAFWLVVAVHALNNLIAFIP